MQRTSSYRFSRPIWLGLLCLSSMSCSLLMTKPSNETAGSGKWTNTPATPVEIAEEIAQISGDLPNKTAVGQWKDVDGSTKVEETPSELASTPSGESRKPSGGKTIEYVIKKGDTLMKIAFEKFGNLYRWKEILNSNKNLISKYNRIIPGTKITIEGVEYVVIEKNGEPYLIRTGDSLSRISKGLYGSQDLWKNLWKNNKQLIHDPNKIYSGFTLYYQSSAKMNEIKNRGPAESHK